MTERLRAKGWRGGGGGVQYEAVRGWVKRRGKTVKEFVGGNGRESFRYLAANHGVWSEAKLVAEASRRSSAFSFSFLPLLPLFSSS